MLLHQSAVCDTPNDTLVEWLKQCGRVWWQKYHLNIFILDTDGVRLAWRIVYHQEKF